MLKAHFLNKYFVVNLQHLQKKIYFLPEIVEKKNLLYICFNVCRNVFYTINEYSLTQKE